MHIYLSWQMSCMMVHCLKAMCNKDYSLSQSLLLIKQVFEPWGASSSIIIGDQSADLRGATYSSCSEIKSLNRSGCMLWILLSCKCLPQPKQLLSQMWNICRISTYTHINVHTRHTYMYCTCTHAWHHSHSTMGRFSSISSRSLFLGKACCTHVLQHYINKLHFFRHEKALTGTEER